MRRLTNFPQLEDQQRSLVHDVNGNSEEYRRIAPIVARHAVHVGWSVDSLDYECGAGDGDCVYSNVTNLLQTPGRGAYGIILMHSVYAQTVNALPRLIAYIRQKGFTIWTVEDLVRARFGQSSLDLVGSGH